MNKSELDKIFTEIAQRTLGIETLEDRRSDRLDFHDVSVVRLRDALEAAFMSGVAHVKTQEYKAVYASLDVDIDDDTPDINVKSEFLIEALEYCIFTFDGYPNLDFNIFNHDDLDDVSGEIRFYSVSLAAGIEASEFEKVIAFSDIEKGRLDEDGAFVCNDIGGSEIRIISSMLAESVVSKNKLYEVLSRVHHEVLSDPSP